jgi:hypothetical protein
LNRQAATQTASVSQRIRTTVRLWIDRKYRSSTTSTSTLTSSKIMKGPRRLPQDGGLMSLNDTGQVSTQHQQELGHSNSREHLSELQARPRRLSREQEPDACLVNLSLCNNRPMRDGIATHPLSLDTDGCQQDVVIDASTGRQPWSSVVPCALWESLSQE